MRKRREKRLHLYEAETYVEAQDRIATICRRLRKAEEWTQEEAAHEIGLTTRLLQRVEAGGSQDPTKSKGTNLTLTTLALLADGYGIDISELFVKPRKRAKRS